MSRADVDQSLNSLMVPATYHFSGDIRRLQLIVELYALDRWGVGAAHSSSFLQLAPGQHQQHGGDEDGGALVASTSLGEQHHPSFYPHKGIRPKLRLIGKRAIMWGERVPRPTPLLHYLHPPATKESTPWPTETPQKENDSEDHVEEEDGSNDRGGAFITELEHRIFSNFFGSAEEEAFPGVSPLPSGGPVMMGTEQSIFRSRPRHKLKPITSAMLKQPVSTQLSEQQRRRSRSVEAEQERMVIAAHLGSLDSSIFASQDDYTLCELTLTNSRLLCVLPELNRLHMLRTPGHGVMYAYRVAVKSSGDDDAKKQRRGEEADFDRLADKPTPRLRGGVKALGRVEAATGEMMMEEGAPPAELPPPHEYWLHYAINIEEGIDFPHDGLKVEYEFDLPPFFRALTTPNSSGKQSLRGRTQLCHTIAEERPSSQGSPGPQGGGGHDVARWSHPIQLSLAFIPTTVPSPPNSASQVHDDDGGGRGAPPLHIQPLGLQWPRLLLRVVAEDEWGRRWVDGYATVSLPINGSNNIQTGGGSCRSAHSTTLCVDCWRVVPAPVNSSNRADHWARLREMFLGQAVDLDGGLAATSTRTTAAARSDAGEGNSGKGWTNFYFKPGLHTQASGQLLLSVQCLHQCRAYIPPRVLRSLRYHNRGNKGNKGEKVARFGLGVYESEEEGPTEGETIGDGYRVDSLSALEWRIIRALEEFEAARRELLRLGRRVLPTFSSREKFA